MFVIKPEQLVGQQMKNYQLVEFLSGGGFGYVYQAVHVKLHKKVAIKLLKPEHVLNTEHLAAFEREAKIIASFTHPHILDIYDYDVFDEIPFIVMPFIEQGSLRKLHPRNSILDMATILFYVKQIASALQYAHDHKIIHRDVKPDNCLYGPQGVLLRDFGIAITAHSINSLSLQDGYGTLFYKAPEQFEYHAQIWSDQYSLAVVVYEWLCGKVPFTGKTVYELYRKHKEEPPPSFKQQGVDVPPAAEQAVRKGLAKKPEERYPNVVAFAEVLEQAVLAHQAAIKSPPIPDNPTPASARVSLLPQASKADTEKQSIHQPSDQVPTNRGKSEGEVQVPLSRRSQEVHDEQETGYRQEEAEYDEALERYNRDPRFRQVYSVVHIDNITGNMKVDIKRKPENYYERTKENNEVLSTLLRNPLGQQDVFAFALIKPLLLAVKPEGSRKTYRELMNELKERELADLKDEFLAATIEALEQLYNPGISSGRSHIREMKKVLQEQVVQQPINAIVKNYEKEQKRQYKIPENAEFRKLSEDEFNNLPNNDAKRQYNRLSKIADRSKEMRELFGDFQGKAEIPIFALLGATLMQARLRRKPPAPAYPSPSPQSASSRKSSQQSNPYRRRVYTIAGKDWQTDKLYVDASSRMEDYFQNPRAQADLLALNIIAMFLMQAKAPNTDETYAYEFTKLRKRVQELGEKIAANRGLVDSANPASELKPLNALSPMEAYTHLELQKQLDQAAHVLTQLRAQFQSDAMTAIQNAYTKPLSQMQEILQQEVRTHTALELIRQFGEHLAASCGLDSLTAQQLAAQALRNEPRRTDKAAWQCWRERLSPEQKRSIKWAKRMEQIQGPEGVAKTTSEMLLQTITGLDLMERRMHIDLLPES